MRNITINTPDGKRLKISAPDGASDEQVKEYAKSAIIEYKAKQSTQQAQGAPKQQGMGSKVWNALDVPRQVAQKTLTGLTNAQNTVQNTIAEKTGLPIGTEPTGNMARDVIANVPRIMGESAAEVLPSFVDRTAILTAGAGTGLKAGGKVAAMGIRKMAPMLEAGSGLQKGTLAAATHDASIIKDFGAKAKAQALYEEAKKGATTFGKKSAKLVGDAFHNINQGAMLTAPDAFKTRKVVRQMLKSKSAPYPTDDLIELEQNLTDMVFRSTNKADALYKRAIQGEQMRNISRLNKNGTTGPMSAAVIAKIPALAPLISPAVQGVAASAAGAAGRMAPSTIAKAATMPEIISQGFTRLSDRNKRKKEKRRD